MYRYLHILYVENQNYIPISHPEQKSIQNIPKLPEENKGKTRQGTAKCGQGFLRMSPTG